jgi:hypothetical protein
MPVPTGPQFVVFHSSSSQTPPHEVEHPRAARLAVGGGMPLSNKHPDIVHAGTLAAAQEVSANSRIWFHQYGIDPSEEYPVTFGDETASTHDNNVDSVNYSDTKNFKEKMSGVQPGLFESVAGTPDIALKSNRAVPYRNALEDAGNISYMIPKGAVGKTVKYLGVKSARELEEGQ